MSNLFEDRQSNYPNRYKITDADGNSSYVTLERADEPVVQGTVLNAATLNQLLPESGGTVTGALTVNGALSTGGNLTANKQITVNGNFVLNGSLVRSKPLSLPMSVVLVSGTHYGTSLPAAGTKGRIYFKKADS